MSFIDASYFVGDLGIPNLTEDTAVAERLTWYIQKYEDEFLKKLLGYPLYKAFVTGMAVTPPATPAQRLLDILYGKEYTDFQGQLQLWKGLIVTSSPVYNLSGGLVYKKPVYVKAGVTPGFTPGLNTATLDGTNGTDDWRGWTPIVIRSAPMTPSIDYSWDPAAGIFQLLRTGDVFGNNEQFFTQFELRTDVLPVSSLETNLSLIANYVYYKYRRDNATQFTGIGEVLTSSDNSTVVSPRRRATNVWNELHRWVKEFCAFMEATQNTDATIYPEWSLINKHDAFCTFGFKSPHY